MSAFSNSSTPTADSHPDALENSITAGERVKTPMRYWTCHWENRGWRDDVNPEYEPVEHSAAKNFRLRGLSAGDIVYVVSLSGGQLLLGGRMRIQQITSRDEAVRLLGTHNLWDAQEHIVGEAGTPLNLHRVLTPEVSRQLRFVSPRSEPKGLCFVSETRLDNQSTRGVRELTRESALLLDRIIEITDQLPHSDEIITVTDEMLHPGNGRDDIRLPEEIPDGSVYSEGSVRQILVNRYERDSRARADCIQHYGCQCIICGFDFARTYGPDVAQIIHVHHVRPLAEIGAAYEVDPIKDLRPVCPNCHAVIHARTPAFSIEEVKTFLQQARINAGVGSLAAHATDIPALRS